MACAMPCFRTLQDKKTLKVSQYNTLAIILQDFQLYARKLHLRSNFRPPNHLEASMRAPKHVLPRDASEQTEERHAKTSCAGDVLLLPQSDSSSTSWFIEQFPCVTSSSSTQ